MTEAEKQKIITDIDRINAMPIKDLATQIHLHTLQELLKKEESNKK